MEERSQKITWMQLLCLLIPFCGLVGLVICMFTVSALQNLFISFFGDCTPQLLQIGFLILIGALTTIVMLPFVLFELAMGYSCAHSYVLPVVICTLAKISGETICFYVGQILSPQLKPMFERLRIFRVIEVIIAESPVKASLLMRLSFVTPQLVMNYGSGIIQTIPYKAFIFVGFLVGVPHTIIVTLVGKEIKDLKEIFSLPQSQNGTLRLIETSLMFVSILCLMMIMYQVYGYYTKQYAHQLNDEEENHNEIQ